MTTNQVSRAGSPMPGQPNILHKRYPKTMRLGKNIHNITVHRLSFLEEPQTGDTNADLAAMFDAALEQIFTEVSQLVFKFRFSD